MAKYDQGGGCACGLQRECDCGSDMRHTRPKRAMPSDAQLYREFLDVDMFKKPRTIHDMWRSFYVK